MLNEERGLGPSIDSGENNARGDDDGENFDSTIQDFVASLCLEQILDPALRIDKTKLPNITHEMRVLNRMISGQTVVPFVKFWIKKKLNSDPDAEEFKSCYEFFRQTDVETAWFKVLRKTIDDKAVSLSEMTKVVYKPQSKEDSRFRSKLRDEILNPLADCGWFTFFENIEKSKSGNDYSAGYMISAGPALLKWNEFIFDPWVWRHAEFWADLVAERRKRNDQKDD